MSGLIDHARRELEAAGLFEETSDYGGMLGNAVMELIEVFSNQGHSGFSAGMCNSIFSKVAAYEPLVPLTGHDEEWMEISDNEYQNTRCSHVFKKNGQAYDIQGRIFRDSEGQPYTNYDSRVSVTFPYTPTRIYVDVEEE